jgi:ATP-dependent protease HslVU (ClpYQ) peptidase subunit
VPKRRVSAKDRLAQGRTAAMEAFIKNREYVREVERLFTDLERQAGLAGTTARLQTYLAAMTDAIRNTGDPALRHQLELETELLRRYLNRSQAGA